MSGARTVAACDADAARQFTGPGFNAIAATLGKPPITTQRVTVKVRNFPVLNKLVERAKAEMGPERWAQLQREFAA